MPLQPMFEEGTDLASRAYADPKKHLAQLLKGMARGAIAMPGDLADMAGMALGQQPAAGDAIRGLLDKTGSLKGEGTTAEGIGELFAPNPLGPGVKAAAGAGILVDAMRASKMGHLPQQAVVDALRMFKQGIDPRKIFMDTRVATSQPSILSPKTQALFSLETPGYSQGPGPRGPLDKATLGQRAQSGDIQGIDDFLAMYPNAGNINVTKTDALDEMLFGSFNPSNKSLVINYALEKNRGAPIAQKMGADKTLGHELRHFASGEDMAPPGASPEMGAYVVNKVGPHLVNRANDLETALLARTLLEDTGRANTSVFGPASVMDLQNVMSANRRAFRNNAPMNNKSAKLALTKQSNELSEMLDLNQQLVQRLPNNPGDAYLKAWDEINARQSEQMLGVPRSILDLTYPGDFPYKHPVPDAQAVDFRDYDPRLLRKLGLI